MEKAAIQELEKWSIIEEKALRQKARSTWIKLGDANNNYFTAVIKERIHKKQIHELTSLDGVKLTQQEIRQEIQKFYNSLMGTTAQTLPAISTEIMRRGPVLNQQQGIELCQPVTEAEIYKGLMSIDDDKTPGVDG